MDKYLKAFYGAAVAGLSTAYALTLNGNHIGLSGGIAIASAVVGALAVIWAVPNAAAAATAAPAADASTPDAAAATTPTK